MSDCNHIARIGIRMKIGGTTLLIECALCKIQQLEAELDAERARQRVAELETELATERVLLDAASRFTFKGPGDYFAAFFDKQSDYWLVEDRDGDVVGEHETRDAAVKQAQDLAAGTWAPVTPAKSER